MSATPFFNATDWLGRHSYFHAEKDAEVFAAATGGSVHETTPGKIWRVTEVVS